MDWIWEEETLKKIKYDSQLSGFNNQGGGGWAVITKMRKTTIGMGRWDKWSKCILRGEENEEICHL